MTTTAVTRLFRDLEGGARAITSSRRLTRQVEQRYADWKMQHGEQAWPTPYIRGFGDWLREIWRTGPAQEPDAPHLLNEDQELLLWEQVIRRHDAGTENQFLLQLVGTATSARRTWQRVHEWCVEWEALRAHAGADTHAFLGWASAVREVLSERRWLTPAELPGRLADNAADRLPDRDRPVWWIGFDLFTPAHQRLRDLLDESGVEQQELRSAGVEHVNMSVTVCGDAEEEWHRVARWARAELTSKPRQSLGVVCPDLDRHRDRIEEILEDVLHPGLIWHIDSPRAYHLSLGRPLSRYPVVATALDLIHCSRRRVPFEVASRVLRSCYLGGAGEESEARARLELNLRRAQQESFTLKRIVDLAGREEGLERLQSLLASAAVIELPERTDPGSWSAVFTEWLRTFGWPGDRPLNSHEYQTVNAWREQLSAFAALGTVQERWALSDVVSKLAAMATSRVLQFQDDRAPLQIVSAAEASGLWFDKLWLADMSDALWPPPVQPDPFIPVSLQKAGGMPAASPQTVLEHTRARTASFLASAAEVRISHATRDAEAPLGLSPLFRDVPDADPDERDAYPGRVAQLQMGAPTLEYVDDHRAPPLTHGSLRGGVRLVADQARCPFQAMAHHRLRANALAQVSPGLDPLTRGSLVHQVAATLWDRLETLDALNAMDDPARRDLVRQCVIDTLGSRYADSAFQRRFLEIERTRLEALFLEWLALESSREAFRVVATELNTTVTLAGAEFKLRVDRVDELADGRRLILDYKTGSQLAQLRDWIDPRMEEPQLPMYALAIDQQVAALAFAGIRRGECELRGVGDGLPFLKPVSDLGCRDMAALKAWWEPVLGALVDEYRRGIADVNPKTPQTCRQCDAMSLCRVFERSADVDG